jgi:16S rRNA (cytosine967-C5)-methyltransferase
VEIAEPVIADAREPLPFKEEADVLILDPPCTGTGTFGRVPSAKWRLTLRSIDTMAKIQWEMLNNCAEKVKTEGVLLYSTSSLTIEENEMQIERFLKWHPEFSLTEITPTIGLPGMRGLEKCRRLYPDTNQCNGFFMARLLRTEN